MDTLSHAEIIPVVEQLIATLEDDENRFYVAIEVLHQLHAELTRILADDE